MNIKTITCHHVYNYGASLQAYALQHFLRTNGHEVSIIDYRPKWKSVRYTMTNVHKERRTYDWGRKFHIPMLLIGIWQNRHEIMNYSRKNAFDAFDKEYLNITSERYLSNDQLRSNPPMASLFIAGSDQIWNTMSNGLDPAYYLDFVGDKSKCISYAASFAISKICDEHKDFVRRMLGNLGSISVREATGKTIVEDLGYNCDVVLDPVFLLDDSHWKTMAKTKKCKPYLLVYDFLHDDPRVKIVAEQIAKGRGLDIVSVNDFSDLHYADININNAGPSEFLGLISNADFVVSTSFHATAFSVIFEREFFTIPLISQKNSSRMSDFLDSIGLSCRLLLTSDNLPCEFINYAETKKKLYSLQEKSRRWLLDRVN